MHLKLDRSFVLLLVILLSSCSFSEKFRGIIPSTLSSIPTDTPSENKEESPPIQIKSLKPAFLEAVQEAVDFGAASLNSIVTQRISITNTGGEPAEDLSSTKLAPGFFYLGGSFPGTGGTCSSTLGSEKTCVMVIAFNPTVLAEYKGILGLTYSSGTIEKKMISIDLKGRGSDLATLKFFYEGTPVGSAGISWGTLFPNREKELTLEVRYFGLKPATGVIFSGISGAFELVLTTCLTIVTKDCQVTIKARGISIGNTEQTLKMDYNNSARDVFDTAVLQVNAPAAATISLGVGETGVIPDTVAGTVRTYDLLLKVEGDFPAKDLKFLPFSSNYFTLLNGYTSELKNTVFTVSVVFSPEAPVLYSDTLRIEYHNGIETVVSAIPISGAGLTPAQLVVSPSNLYDYGSIPIGFRGSKDIVITNVGSSPALGLQVLGTASPFTIAGSNCKSSLGAGAKCAVTVVFSPKAEGLFEQVLQFSYQNGLSSTVLSILLKGTGSSESFLTWNSGGSTLAFGTLPVGSSKNLTLVLNKFGAPENRVTDLSLQVSGEAFSGNIGDCTALLNSDGTCNVILTFSPTAPGNFLGSVVVGYTNSSGVSKTTFSYNLTGTGLAPAVLGFSPQTLDFGLVDLGSSKQLTVNISSNGQVARSVVATGLTPPFTLVTVVPSKIMSNTSLKVNFKPTTSGEFSALLTLAYDDGIEGVKSINLVVKGGGVPVSQVQIGSSPFPDTMIGTSSISVIRLQNQGTASASIAVSSIPSQVFQVISQDCGALLSPGSSCTVQVSFLSPTPGRFSTSAEIVVNGVAKLVPLAANAIVPIQIAAGLGFTCVLNKVAQVVCFGRNDQGQLGNGTKEDVGGRLNQMGAALAPVDFGKGRYAQNISAGSFHACAHLDDSTVKCWGQNSAGQLGQGDTQNRGDEAGELGDALNRVPLEGGGFIVKSLSLGYEHTCALSVTGEVKCWGGNAEGQLGLGNTETMGDQPSEMGALLPLKLGGIASQISAGANHTCVQTSDGSVRCWGNNAYGQLGQGHEVNIGQSSSVPISSLSPIDFGSTFGSVSLVSAGGANTFAVNGMGQIKAIGFNHELLGTVFGQNLLGEVGPLGGLFSLLLNGVGTRVTHMGNALPLFPQEKGEKTKTVSVSSSHALALSETGKIKAWGKNDRGQLGLGDQESRGETADEMGAALPEVETGFSEKITQVSAGQTHSCATDGKKVKCWGDNQYGQLGLGDFEARGDEPNEMGALLPFVVLE